jgi:cell shape-determining protein MreC
VRRELREALARLEEQGRRLQGLEQEKEALQQALAAARSQRSSAAAAGAVSAGDAAPSPSPVQAFPRQQLPPLQR